MAKIIQIRRDTSTNWQTINPTLAQGELGYETDTGKLKIGDGVTAWNDLPYFGGDSGIAHPAGNPGEVQFNLDNNTLGADSNLFWDNTNKRLGIGTNTPNTRLHVNGDTTLDDGSIIIQAISTPSNPDTNYGKIFHSSINNELYWLKSDGTIKKLSLTKFIELDDVSGEKEEESLLRLKDGKIEFTHVVFPHGSEVSSQRSNIIPYKTGLIIPYYEYPWDSNTSAWKTSFIDMITFLKEFHNVPVMVIVNPSNGAGDTVDIVWTRAIKMLRGAGCIVLGYVDTNYTNNSIESVKSEIDNWKNKYYVDGIFLDQMTNDDVTENIDYYKELTEYAHYMGYYPVIGNAGALVPSSYFLNRCADIIIIHENNTYPNESDLAGGDWEDSYREIPYWKKASIVWGQSTLDKSQFRMMQKYCGFVYVTSSTDYSSQPDYLIKELFYCSLYDNPHPDIDDGFDFGSHVAYFTLQTYTTDNSNVTIDWNKGNKAKITLTQDATLTFIDPPGACNLILYIEQDSNGGHNITFPSNVKWAGGLEITPTDTPNAVDIVSLFFDGVNYYAIANYNFS